MVKAEKGGDGRQAREKRWGQKERGNSDVPIGAFGWAAFAFPHGRAGHDSKKEVDVRGRKGAHVQGTNSHGCTQAHPQEEPLVATQCR